MGELDILDTWQEDANNLLATRKEKVRDQVLLRLLLAVDLERRLQDGIQDLGQTIVNLQPAHPNAPDNHRQERLMLERDRRLMLDRYWLLWIDAWRDTQNLLLEERNIDEKILEQHQRRERLSHYGPPA